MAKWLWGKGLGALIGLGMAVGSAPALAQSYPTRAVTIIVPLAAGTGMDTLARLYGDQLAQALGKPVVVENRPGAGLMLGTAACRVLGRADRHRAAPAYPCRCRPPAAR